MPNYGSTYIIVTAVTYYPPISLIGGTTPLVCLSAGEQMYKLSKKSTLFGKSKTDIGSLFDGMVSQLKWLKEMQFTVFSAAELE